MQPRAGVCPMRLACLLLRLTLWQAGGVSRVEQGPAASRTVVPIDPSSMSGEYLPANRSVHDFQILLRRGGGELRIDLDYIQDLHDFSPCSIFFWRLCS